MISAAAQIAVDPGSIPGWIEVDPGSIPGLIEEDLGSIPNGHCSHPDSGRHRFDSWLEREGI